MPAHLTKNDLRSIYGALGRLLPPGAPLRDPADVVEVNRVRGVLALVIEETLPVRYRGRRVLVWRIPNAHAPTLNRYAFMKGWLKGTVMKRLTDSLLKLIEQSPNALLHGALIQRWVRVTRFTPSRGKVDEVSCDAIGGKMPIDALVHAGVLYDDAKKYLHREALVATTSRGNTHVLVEVFEMGDDSTHDHDTPRDAAVEQVKKKRGPIAAAIANQRHAEQVTVHDASAVRRKARKPPRTHRRADHRRP